MSVPFIKSELTARATEKVQAEIDEELKEDKPEKTVAELIQLSKIIETTPKDGYAVGK